MIIAATDGISDLESGIIGTLINTVERSIAISIDGIWYTAATNPSTCLIGVIWAAVVAVFGPITISVIIAYATSTNSRLSLIGVVRTGIRRLHAVWCSIAVCIDGTWLTVSRCLTVTTAADSSNYLEGVSWAAIIAIRYTIAISVIIASSTSTFTRPRLCRIKGASIYTVRKAVTITIHWTLTVVATTHTWMDLVGVVLAFVFAVRRSIIIRVNIAYATSAGSLRSFSWVGSTAVSAIRRAIAVSVNFLPVVEVKCAAAPT